MNRRELAHWLDLKVLGNAATERVLSDVEGLFAVQPEQPTLGVPGNDVAHSQRVAERKRA